MIYLVTLQQSLFNLEGVTNISVRQSLHMAASWSMLQLDTETTGRDPHLCEVLSLQLGDPEGKDQIVIDATTIDLKQYKELIESKFIIGHNLKFDLQFLYNLNIVPRKVYDTMIVEQFLHLGYPQSKISYSLKEVAWRYLGVDIDKSIRGDIIWRGLDLDVINYAAGDVKYLADIMKEQLKIIHTIPNAIKGAQIECNFTPAVAYLEWCGIKLDEDKWKVKMEHDKKSLEEALNNLNNYALNHPKLKKWCKVNTQGDLWEGFDLTPKWTVDWQKKEVINVVQALGFDTKTVSKATKKETDSVMEKVLSNQKGIDDEFLRLYFEYQGRYKIITSFGQGHLNAINPKTGRLHTVYRAIGTASGRMSSGSQQSNTDLAKYKKIRPDECTYPNMQQLPHDAETRACFVAEKGNLFCSCDWSAMEARIGAEVYNERKLLDEFLYGSGDTHAAYAKEVFKDELKDIPTKDIKKKRKDLRDRVKSVEFAVQFGSDGTAVAPQLGISVEEARKLVQNLLNGMTGLKSFKERKSKFVLQNGYVEIMPQTGHRGYWYDWKDWKERQASFTPEFWDDYKAHHKGTGDRVAQMVKEHFQAKSKWCDRMSLNMPTQGGGAILLKIAATRLFNWIVDNGYFGKIKLVNFTHDEINSEFPEELKDTYPKLVEQFMLEAGAMFYHKLPIPAEAAVGDHWIH